MKGDDEPEPGEGEHEDDQREEAAERGLVSDGAKAGDEQELADDCCGEDLELAGAHLDRGGRAFPGECVDDRDRPEQDSASWRRARTAR